MISQGFGNHGKDEKRQENIRTCHLKNVDLYVASVNTVNSIKLLVKHVNHISSNFTQVTSSPNRMNINGFLDSNKIVIFHN